MQRRTLHINVLIGVLALLVSALTIGQTGLSPAEAEGCQYPLFPDKPGEGLPPQPPIDFCRELVIVDPVIMEALPDVSFRKVMADLFRTGAPPIADVINGWAATWRGNGSQDPAYARAIIEENLRDAWRYNRIKLIAITNRLDLGQNPKSPLGEARLIYQLFTETSQPAGMTIILEFKHPEMVSGGIEKNIAYWADRWHQLGDSKLTRKDYVGILGDIIADFNQCRNIKKIRTNEQYDLLGTDHWEFREFNPVCATDPDTPAVLGIKWSQLTNTPADSYRSTTGKPLLAAYLGNWEVSRDLRNGGHSFDTHYAGVAAIAMGWVAQTDSAWILPSSETGSADLLRMAFNTCNGCHADMQQPRNARPQIAVLTNGGYPLLASFLRQAIPLRHRLPGCEGNRPPQGCITWSTPRYAWDERKNRIEYMDSNLTRTKEQREVPSYPAAVSTYRYH